MIPTDRHLDRAALQRGWVVRRFSAAFKACFSDLSRVSTWRHVRLQRVHHFLICSKGSMTMYSRFSAGHEADSHFGSHWLLKFFSPPNPLAASFPNHYNLIWGPKGLYLCSSRAQCALQSGSLKIPKIGLT